MLPVNFGILRTGMLLVLIMSASGCSSIRIETPSTYLARQEALENMKTSAPAAGYSVQNKADKKENALD